MCAILTFSIVEIAEKPANLLLRCPKGQNRFLFHTENRTEAEAETCRVSHRFFFSRSLDICKNGVPHNHHELTSAHHVMFLLLTHGVTLVFLSLPVAYWYAIHNFTFCNVEFDNEFLNQMSKLEFFLVSLQHYLIIFLITFNPRTVSGLRHMV